MGRAEWLSWIGGGGVAAASARRGRMYPDMKETDKETSSGCMCSAFQFFDSHPLKILLNKRRPSVNFRLDSHFFRQEEAIDASIGLISHKHIAPLSPFIFHAGIQAPRNSLELEEPAAMKGGLKPQQALKEEEQNSNFPVGIQVKTRISTTRTEDFSAELTSSSSPGKTTPNLVARLMGLDLISESNPTPKMKSHLGNFPVIESGRCSLNDDMRETPRISSPRRSKEIVMKVKESVGRRAGLVDITNTNREKLETGRDQDLVTLKNTSYVSETSRSKKDTKSGSTKSPRASASSESQGIFSSLKVPNQQEKNKKKTGISRNVIQNKKEEQFVRSAAAMKTTSADKMSKITPLSSELLNASAPALVPVKKVPSTPDTKLPKKQPQVTADALSSKRTTQVSCNTSQSYKRPEDFIPDNRNCGAATSSAGVAVEYKHYVRRILRRAGITDGVTPLTLGKWHNPSHPLDPSIFYYLELFNRARAGAALSLRCNRKMIFQVVDEILAGILKSYLDFKPWGASGARFNRLDLVDEICRRLGQFPAAKCQILGDIDSLVDGDLIEQPKLDGFLEEEGEILMCEIEGEILESLVREMVVVIGAGGSSPENWYRTRH